MKIMKLYKNDQTFIVDKENRENILFSKDTEKYYSLSIQRDAFIKLATPEDENKFYLAIGDKLVETNYKTYRNYNDWVIFDDGKTSDIYCVYEEGMELIIKDLPVLIKNLDKMTGISFWYEGKTNSPTSLQLLELNYDNKTIVVDPIFKKIILETSYRNIQLLFDSFSDIKGKAKEFNRVFIVSDIRSGKNLIIDNKPVFSTGMMDIEPFFVNETKVYISVTDPGQAKLLYDLVERKYLTTASQSAIFQVIKEDKQDKYITIQKFDEKGVLYDENMNEIFRFDKMFKLKNITGFNINKKGFIYIDGLKEKTETKEIISMSTMTKTEEQKYINPYFILTKDGYQIFDNYEGKVFNKKTYFQVILIKDTTIRQVKSYFYLFVDQNKKPFFYNVIENVEQKKFDFQELEIENIMFNFYELFDVFNYTILNKEEIIKLLTRTSYIDKYNKKSDSNILGKKVYSTQLITEAEYLEIQDYFKQQNHLRDIYFPNTVPKKEVDILLKKINKNDVKPFVKGNLKSVLESRLFDIWSN